MNRRLSKASAFALSLSLCGVSALAQAQGSDFGRSEYQSNCASCHGPAGKGDGPVALALSKKPSDLTTLAKRSGGALPVQLVWDMIDGRSQVPLGVAAHGSRDMPVWGDDYRALARLSGDPAVASNPEWYVRGRIVALIDYLQRIQAK
jgi:mono/diheme cytochrome c family protein